MTLNRPGTAKALISQRDRGRASTAQLDEESRARAVRMYPGRIHDLGKSKLTGRRQVGAVLDISPATLRNWVDREDARHVATKGDSACVITAPADPAPDGVTSRAGSWPGHLHRVSPPAQIMGFSRLAR